MPDNQLLTFIVENMRDMRQEINDRLANMEAKIDTLVTKDECARNKEICPVIRQEKKIENKAGLITAYLLGAAGLITAIFGAINIFYN